MSKVVVIKTDNYADVPYALREGFSELGYDPSNPLGGIIKPGDKVFIKPNFCTHEYGRKKEKLKGDIFSVITHPSVITAVLDNVLVALKGEGQVVIGDNPTIDANWSKLMEVTNLDKIIWEYQKNNSVRISLVDLREMWCDNIDNYGHKDLMKKLPGDPEGDRTIDLGKKSFFRGLNPFLFRGVFNNRWETIRHHLLGRHVYHVSGSIYDSDVFISIPKLKTHHKTGVTLNIKGLVGTITQKNCLIHWRNGFPLIGGDEYPSFKAWLKGGYRGAWHGNDTCWRMAADLYQVLMSKPRKTFSVIDGVVAGEGNGPFCPDKVDAKTLIMGESLVGVDYAAIELMGFDVTKVKNVYRLLEGFERYSAPYNLNFKPPKSWQILKKQ